MLLSAFGRTAAFQCEVQVRDSTRSLAPGFLSSIGKKAGEGEEGAGGA